MKTINPVYKEKLFATINESPFPRHQDMKIVDIGLGFAVFEMPIADFRMQPFGVQHGGNLATLIDSATFWAAYFAMGNDSDGLTTVDLKLNYLAPALREKLLCRGSLIKEGKTLFYAEARVENLEGKILAHGTSTLMRLPTHGLKLGLPLFV